MLWQIIFQGNINGDLRITIYFRVNIFQEDLAEEGILESIRFDLREARSSVIEQNAVYPVIKGIFTLFVELNYQFNVEK